MIKHIIGNFLCLLVLILFFNNSSHAQIRINEFQATNSSIIEDPDFKSSADWIEIYNGSSNPASIQGYYLTDDLSKPDKWQITSAATIPAKGYLLIWADNEDTGLHTNFKLSSDGEQIGLYDPNLSPVDEFTFGLQKTDVSMGRSNADASWVFFFTPTPGVKNSDSDFTDFTKNTPDFSLRGGLFETPVQLTLSAFLGGSVRYTTDGTEPSNTSTLFTQAIDITSSQVIRARVFDADNIPGPVITHSYFIQAPHQLPVVSIVTDPDNFWDNQKGIYVQDFKPEWEIPVNIELFENIGGDRAAFNLEAGVKVNGLYSWQLPQKMLGVYFKGKYSGKLGYQLFFDRTRNSFSDFALRASGSDWSYTLFRDKLGQDAVAQGMKLATMAFRESVLYVNGQYMGIHNMREKVDEDFIVGNYGLEAGTFDMVENEDFAETGSLDAYQHLQTLFSKDLSVQANFDAVAVEMDVENFTDLVITELYVRNSSLSHNVMCWKPKNSGKWQWILMDLDRGFFSPSKDFINYYKDQSVIPFKDLMANDGYKTYFANRLADHLMTTFHPDQMKKLIDKHHDTIADEIARHIDRWQGTTSSYGNAMASVDYWEGEVDKLVDFVERRPDYLISDLANYGFSNTANLTVGIEPASAGKIWLNDLKLAPSSSGKHLIGSALNFKAKANPGFTFKGWRLGAALDLISTADILTKTFDASLNLVAVFDAISACTVPSVLTNNLTLSANCSPYVANDILVPEGITLTIEAGVELRLSEKANIMVNGQIVVNGTDQLPVLITGDPTNEKPWGAIVLLNSSELSTFAYTTIQGASVGPIPVRDKAAISAFKSDVSMDHLTIENVASNPIFAQYSSIQLSNSQLHSEVSGDLINVKYGSAEVSNSVFKGNFKPDTDGVDFDQIINGKISNCQFYNFLSSNSDAIDIGEGAQNIMIDNVIVYNVIDKGVSVGQRSSVHVTNSLFVNTGYGVAAKDSSYVSVDHCTFFNTVQGVACYEKNPGQAGGNAVVSNSIMSNSPLHSYSADDKSTIKISYSLSDTDELPVDFNNLLANPLFQDSEHYNFQLEATSPAKSGDQDGGMLGSTINSLDFEVNVKIIQIFDDPNDTGAAEFIAIVNPTSMSIDLSGYSVDRGFTATIAQGTILLPNDTLYLSNDTSTEWWTGISNVQQWEDGKLSNGGETIQLLNQYGLVIDHVKYDNKAPWPTDGEVYTLKDISADNHFGANWKMIADIRSHIALSVAPQVQKTWSFYPNPAENTLTLNIPNDLDSIEIYSLSGKLEKVIQTSQQKDLTIDVSSFQRGIHLIRNGDQVRKLVLL